MREDEARAILATQALEEVDSSGEFLSPAERREAAAAAGGPLPPGTTPLDEDRFLIARARWLLARARERWPNLSEWAPVAGEAGEDGAKGSPRWTWIAGGLALLAVAAGYLSSELGPERRINILSYPLLGILAWSFVVYARELVTGLRGDSVGSPGLAGLVRFLEGGAGNRASRGDEELAALSGEASRRYRARWARVAMPLWKARVKSWLHLLAFLLALSAVAGLYVKGLANEYRAVWESTFFEDGASLRPLLVAVLGPAAALTGREIPDATALDAMRWQAGAEAVAGESAAWWIHWYAATIALFVLAPRALLGLLWGWRAKRVAAGLEVRPVGQEYFERVLALSSGATLPVLVVPYATRTDEVSRSRIADAMEARRGRRVDLRWGEPILFGDEEAVPDLSESSESLEAQDPGEVAVLFNFSDTPEVETHLAVLQTLLDAAPYPVKSVLVDAASFQRRFGSVAEAEERFAERTAAWRRLVPETLELIAVAEGAREPEL